MYAAFPAAFSLEAFSLFGSVVKEVAIGVVIECNAADDKGVCSTRAESLCGAVCAERERESECSEHLVRRF